MTRPKRLLVTLAPLAALVGLLLMGLSSESVVWADNVTYECGRAWQNHDIPTCESIGQWRIASLAVGTVALLLLVALTNVDLTRRPRTLRALAAIAIAPLAFWLPAFANMFLLFVPVGLRPIIAFGIAVTLLGLVIAQTQLTTVRRVLTAVLVLYTASSLVMFSTPPLGL